jgi:signal transduction histidine kinase
MTPFTRISARSIRTRLVLALLLISLLTLGFSTLVSAIMDLRLFRDQMTRDLQVLAAVVGETCVSALVFQSPETAERYLGTLEREYQIRSAALLDAADAPFASWSRAGAQGPSPGPLSGWLAVEVEVVQPILYDGRPIGRLVLQGRLEELGRQFLAYLAIGGLVALITFGLAWALALRLQRRIAGPILALAERSRAISVGRDSSGRLPDPNAGEEISVLVRGFNAILQGLSERESELSRKASALDQANEKLRRMAMDLAMLEETEKARLASELHDGPIQQLALAQIQIEVAARLPQEEASDRLMAGVELLSEAIRDLRGLQFDLSPPVLESGGLSAALSWLAESTQSRWGLDLSYRLDGALPALDRPRKVLLFQCARELVMNLVKHANARRGAIQLAVREARLELQVEDDGIGFAGSHTARDPGQGEGYGLRGVCERLALVDGGLTLEDLRPGARVQLWIPLGEWANYDRGAPPAESE